MDRHENNEIARLKLIDEVIMICELKKAWLTLDREVDYVNRTIQSCCQPRDVKSQ